MEYWYLWVLFAVLCLVTVFVLYKASGALQQHNNDKKQLLEEIDRLKALKDKFQHASKEEIEACESREVLDGVQAVLQSKIERADDPETCFSTFLLPSQYLYTLYYFLEDSETALSFFLGHNGEPLCSLASPALAAVGEEELSALVKEAYTAYNADDDVSRFDAPFKEAFDRARISEHCKTYVLENRETVLS